MSVLKAMLPRQTESGRRAWFTWAVSWGLPLLLIVGGIVMVILGHARVSDVTTNQVGVSPGAASPFTATPTDKDSMFTAIGVGAVITAAMVWMVGWMMRLSISSSDDRDKEEADRAYFTRTGRWPGERGPG